MALSRVVSEIFNVEKYRDLEIPVKRQSRSLKVVPFDRLNMDFLMFIRLKNRENDILTLHSINLHRFLHFGLQFHLVFNTIQYMVSY